MTHPKTRAERRRNHIAADLKTSKYRQRIVTVKKIKQQVTPKKNWRLYLDETTED